MLDSVPPVSAKAVRTAPPIHGSEGHVDGSLSSQTEQKITSKKSEGPETNEIHIRSQIDVQELSVMDQKIEESWVDLRKDIKLDDHPNEELVGNFFKKSIKKHFDKCLPVVHSCKARSGRIPQMDKLVAQSMSFVRDSFPDEISELSSIKKNLFINSYKHLLWKLLHQARNPT